MIWIGFHKSSHIYTSWKNLLALSINHLIYLFKDLIMFWSIYFMLNHTWLNWEQWTVQGDFKAVEDHSIVINCELLQQKENGWGFLANKINADRKDIPLFSGFVLQVILKVILSSGRSRNFERGFSLTKPPAQLELKIKIRSLSALWVISHKQKQV